jgi:uncharacterized Ntn-hydrolase superfamily protein
MFFPKYYFSKHLLLLGFLVSLILFIQPLRAQESEKNLVSTFSIVARDPETGELGIAVASRFFAVGSVVPWAKANIGAIATQSFANTTFGPNGLELLEKGKTPEEVLQTLLNNDDNPDRRQVGIVSSDGKSATYTGAKCISWAGGRNGTNYAIQGNILTGENVVLTMEETFLKTEGTLADKLYAALLAGDVQGGDSRGKQSAAMLVVKEKAGYGGYNDRAIDIRVDDNPEPFIELGRLLQYAQMNYLWNEAWTFYTNEKYKEALPLMERTAKLAPENPEVLFDLVLIQLAAGEKEKSLTTLEKAIRLNPKLIQQALSDPGLKGIQDDPKFKELVK